MTTLLLMPGTSNAALIDLGDGTVRDDATNLIWLRNWDVNGQKDWGTQKAWAESFSFAGSADWRLPLITEFAGLFANYGQQSGGLTARSEFINIRSPFYWSGSEVVAGDVALLYHPGVGFQLSGAQVTLYYAVAVRSDNALSVQAPHVFAVALMALVATLVTRRKRPA